MKYEVKNISTSYGNKNILNNVSFEFEENRITALIGENGSGKTTLIKSLCNLLPHKGSLNYENFTISDLSVLELSKVISYIPQRSGIEIDIKVLDVVMMGFYNTLKLFESPDSKQIEKAVNALNLVGLGDRKDDSYQNLSIGQKQLCLLARSLVSNSRILMLDEPESALDFNWRYELFELLKNQNKTVLIVLHDLSLALNYCDSIILLNKGTVIDTINPKSDSLSRIEEALNKIYNNVKISETFDNKHRYLNIYKAL